MDSLEHAKTLYRKRHIHANALTPSDHGNLSLSITKLIRTSLTQQGGISSFKYLPFISVIQRTVSTNCFQGNQAARAFVELEKYLLLLLSQPWKREFWLLKTYGGFFRTKVKAHLESPEEVMQLVGYMTEGEPSASTSSSSSTSSCLILDHPPDPEVVLSVAFDCQVAAEECLYIAEYYEKMRCVGLSLSEAMGVLLSGTSTDPVPQFPVMAGLHQGKSNNNNVMGVVHPDVLKPKGAPPPPSRDMMQTVVGLPPHPGRGAAVPGTTNSVHQVTGVPAAHPAQGMMHSPHVALPGFVPPPAPQPALYPPQHSVADQRVALGLKAEVQQLQQHPPVGGGVGDPGFRQMPVLSRAAYASSASAQSSGYGSGSASVLSAPSAAYGPSSAFSGSCGYSSNSHPHLPSPAAPMYNYTYSGQTQHNSGDYVDSPPVTAPQLASNISVSPRHSRQLVFPPSQHRSPADFPYIDDEDPALSPVFPHEGHGGFVNVQGEPERGRGRGVPPTMPEMLRSEGLAVPFEGGMHRIQDLRPGIVGAGGGGMGHLSSSSSSGMVHRPSQQQQSSEMMRFPQATPSQPATAVMAMLNTSSVMDVSQQKMQGGQYPPLSVAGNASAMGTRENQARSIPNKPPESNGHRFVEQSLSQPVYHPPTSNPLPFQRYSSNSPVSASVSQSQKPPTFAQIAAAGKTTDNQALLARQAQGLSSTATGLGSQEKGQLAKSIINSGRSGSGSSSEVILREKVKTGPVRGSSMVAPSRAGSTGQDQGFSRQSSQSMDLGMLKWRCRTCTMENSTMETICSACSKSRNAPDLPFPAAGESKRFCPACTFENQPGNSMCEMCSTALTDVHTYV